MCAAAAQGKLDRNWPVWAPRKPSAAEEEHLRKVRGMQEHIRRHMGSRSMRSFHENDIREILVNFGDGWAEALPYYQDAINPMDQGVPA